MKQMRTYELWADMIPLHSFSQLSIPFSFQKDLLEDLAHLEVQQCGVKAG